ncbi:permease for cytosine/purines, uracil, thiamine, allantoin-domain-containing protein [Myxozyma melibiosi]|uniref:Permease for cytosine/purines, uracil, thiamine, allantoin-domain-containing protein n=1 Tax=Myxozyma melibiosi TaxID=54550 RepID=A0ABR1F559_9ASCO
MSKEVAVDSYGVQGGYEGESTGLWHRFVKRIELDTYEKGLASNVDLDPVPPEKRTWNWWHFISYWISDNFTPSGWRKASSLMSLGMSWKIALVNVCVAECLIAAVITVNGYLGAKYHISFTVLSRAAFGYYFSLLMIAMRMIVGTFWYGISAYSGAECVRSMLYAIWPSFRNVSNGLPASAHIDTQLMTSYFLYFLFCLPLHYVPIHKIRFLFTVKAITVPIIGFGIMGWTIAQTDGEIWKTGNLVHGSELGWVFMSGIYSNMAGWATLAVNAPDFTRYAISPKHSYTMAIALPATATLIAFFGVVGAAGSKIMWGEQKWDPLVFIDMWTSKGGRAAAFFCAAGFFLAQALANISANSISAANDLNCLFPRFINIRRGQYIVAVIGAWAFVPWDILTSATSFLAFMNGYGIWLAPICGIMISDFFIIRKRKLDTWALYDKHGIYRYNKYGTNWRAAVAWCCGWVPLLPGFLPNVNSSIHVVSGMQKLYKLGYFYGFSAAFVSYLAVSWIWPPHENLLERAVYSDDEQVIMARDEEDMIESSGAESLEKKASH